MNSTVKTKEIMMLQFAQEKQRLKAQKDLEKKLQKAEKVANQQLKQKKEQIKKHLEKSMNKIAEMQMRDKNTKREHMGVIQEFEEE